MVLTSPRRAPSGAVRDWAHPGTGERRRWSGGGEERWREARDENSPVPLGAKIRGIG